jgi:hypothetical protein
MQVKDAMHALWRGDGCVHCNFRDPQTMSALYAPATMLACYLKLGRVITLYTARFSEQTVEIAATGACNRSWKLTMAFA